MRKMEITGAQVKGFKLNEGGTSGNLTVVATVFKNKTKHSLWICAILKGRVLEYYQKNPIEGGISLGGTFDVDSYTGNDGKLYPRIRIVADWIEAADAYGSGLMRVTLRKGRLSEDLRVKDGVAYAKMAFNYTTVERTMWCDLTFWGDLAKKAEAMKFKKGSTVDVDASFDVEVNTKDDKQYMNILLNVKDIAYTALPPKAKEPETPPETSNIPEVPSSNPSQSTAAQTNSPAPSADNTAVQETNLEETVLEGEPQENEFF